MHKKVYFTLSLFFLTIIFISCGSEKVSLQGAGATFPALLYQKWFSLYQKKTGVEVNYQPTGSGAGQKQFADEILMFAGSDTFMDAQLIEQMKNKGHEVVHIPTVLSAVVIAFNLDEIDELKLSKDIIADIFLGKITSWSDSRILKDNPELKGVKLPENITIVHRADGSGTTEVFTEYLSKISPEWEKSIGTGKSVNWPAKNTVGAKGNSGVAQSISTQEGSIGYLSWDFAINSGTPMATLQDASGNWVYPSMDSVSLSFPEGDVDLQKPISLILKEVEGAYPISTPTYLILAKDLDYRKNTKSAALGLVKLLQWLTTEEAKAVAKEANFIPLSEKVSDSVRKELKTITFNKEILLKD